MYKILYRQQPIDRINGYSKRYREYSEERFTDTGIFSESILRDMYVTQSLDRRDELFTLIGQVIMNPSFADETIARCMKEYPGKVFMDKDVGYGVKKVFETIELTTGLKIEYI